MEFSQLISSLRYIEKKVKEHKLPKYTSKILLFLLIFLNLLTADEVDQNDCCALRFVLQPGNTDIKNQTQIGI